MSGCDIIEHWDEGEFSGEGGRLDQLSDFIDEFMDAYGFEGPPVAEDPSLMANEFVPAKYDPDSNIIYFDSEYLAGDDITANEAVYLAIHEAVHAMDVLEDGSLDVPEGSVADAAYDLAGYETDDCQSHEPGSSSGEGDTGGW